MRNMHRKVGVISKIISDRRKNLKIKQPIIANQLGISARTYQRKESGNMGLEEFVVICQTLRLTIILVPDENI